MFYTIYKVTNQVNGKFYVGSHKTKNLDDNYMGSGRYLKYAQAKYGIENFKKEILFVFNTPEEMYIKEAEIVNEDFLATENTYNLKVGGFGGFDYINSNPEKYLTEKRISSLMSIEERRKRWREKYDTDESFREKIKENALKGFKRSRELYPNGAFVGRTHTKETKQKMSESKRITSAGSRNSQFGKMWITNGQENMKIEKDAQLPEGFRPGRVMK